MGIPAQADGRLGLKAFPNVPQTSILSHIPVQLQPYPWTA